LLGRDNPLRIAGFRRLAVSYGVNELGDTFALVALALVVFGSTSSALATAGLFLCSKFVPAITAPWLTARLDRAAVRVVLPSLYAVEALAFGGLAFLATSFSLALVLALAFVDGALALTARGLSRAAIAAVLAPRQALRAGNAVLNGIFSVTGAAGPALAGVVVATGSAQAALAIDAASFGLVAVILATSRDLPPARLEAPQPWVARVRAGIRYVRDRPVVRTLVAAEGVGWVFFTLITPIEVVYATRSLDAGATGFGALIAAWGVGMVAGSFLFARARDVSTRTLVGSSTLLVGVGYLGMAGAPEIISGCFAAAVGGVGNGVQWISVLTALQENTEEAFQARVVGLMESISAAAPGIGFLLGGALTAIWSPRLAFVIAGMGVVVVAAAMARRLPRE
jgi:MFS family permease